MKNPFKKPDATAIEKLMAGMTYRDKLRVSAALKTTGELEFRLRQHKNGGISASLWLAVVGDDAALRLVPAPDKVRGSNGNAGDVH